MCFLACSLRSSCNSVLCCLSRSCLPVRTLKEVRFLRVAVFCVCVCVTAKHCMMRPCSVKIECLSYSICGPSSSATRVISSTHKNADPFELGKLQRLSNVSLPSASTCACSPAWYATPETGIATYRGKHDFTAFHVVISVVIRASTEALTEDY